MVWVARRHWSDPVWRLILHPSYRIGLRGMAANQFASLWATSGVPTLHPLPASQHNWLSPLLTPQIGNRIGLRVWLFALSGLYRRVLDGQIVCQIGCLYLLMYPCSPGRVYSREAATFQCVNIQCDILKCLVLWGEYVRKWGASNIRNWFAFVSCILAGTWHNIWSPAVHMCAVTLTVEVIPPATWINFVGSFLSLSLPKIHGSCGL